MRQWQPPGRLLPQLMKGTGNSKEALQSLGALLPTHGDRQPFQQIPWGCDIQMFSRMWPCTAPTASRTPAGHGRWLAAEGPSAHRAQLTPTAIGWQQRGLLPTEPSSPPRSLAGAEGPSAVGPSSAENGCQGCSSSDLPKSQQRLLEFSNQARASEGQEAHLPSFPRHSKLARR